MKSTNGNEGDFYFDVDTALEIYMIFTGFVLTRNNIPPHEL